ncbi:Hsp20/alpha crystallin family protein [Pseudocnuella soli]|uniref:Hsp20/alpha crystallin family protein n=1 Tax=Pseudocnuella soli TaxID=2502779 RepID=UPI00104B5004|nr:Hsp20/alpha crystallin family protein [Pseudocnuella soli]
MTTYKLANRPFEQSFNNILDDFFYPAPSLFKNGANGNGHSTPVNIRKTENGYELQLVAPGFEKEAFKIDLDKNLLTIAAAHKAEGDKQQEGFIRTEFRQRSFKRSFTLDETIDAEKIEARYHNGILVLNLPKKVEVKEPVKQISIQ